MYENKQHFFHYAALPSVKERCFRRTCYVRITVNGEQTELSLKETDTSKAMEGYETASDGRSRQIKALNTHLDNVKFKIKEKYRSLLDKEATITPQIMKNAYLGNQLNKKGIQCAS